MKYKKLVAPSWLDTSNGGDYSENVVLITQKNDDFFEYVSYSINPFNRFTRIYIQNYEAWRFEHPRHSFQTMVKADRSSVDKQLTLIFTNIFHGCEFSFEESEKIE